MITSFDEMLQFFEGWSSAKVHKISRSAGSLQNEYLRKTALDAAKSGPSEGLLKFRLLGSLNGSVAVHHILHNFGWTGDIFAR